MQYSINRLRNKQDILSYLIMECIEEEHLKQIAERSQELETENEEQFEITLTIDGKEYDVEKFFNQIYNVSDNLIIEAARQIVREQTSEKVTQFGQKVGRLIDQVEDMCEDIQFDTEGKNPFKNLEHKSEQEK